MKVVIFAGGFGTRLAEETRIVPKPMVRIGEHPMLWHIMSWYAKFGFKDFVIALGYKSTTIKEYFLHYNSLSNDFEINLGTGDIRVINKLGNDWKVSLIDTGLNTMTGGRLKRLQNHLGDHTFMATYGDGLSTINIESLLNFHRESGKIATVSAVFPTARFGELELDSKSNVKSFREKPQLENGRINGGFFVFEPSIFNYLHDDNTILEREPLEGLVNDGELAAFRHDGFWQSMDTLREKHLLEELWNTNKAPWK